MSQDTLDPLAVKRRLYCPVCSSMYSDSRLPIIIPCGHTICSPCLLTLNKLLLHQHFICPVLNCKRVLSYSACFIQSDEMRVNISKEVALKEYHREKSEAKIYKECCTHELQYAYECLTDGEIVCLECITEEGKHAKHQLRQLQVSYELLENDIQNFVHTFKSNMIEELQSELREILIRKVSAEIEEFSLELNKVFDSLRQQLETPQILETISFEIQNFQADKFCRLLRSALNKNSAHEVLNLTSLVFPEFREDCLSLIPPENSLIDDDGLTWTCPFIPNFPQSIRLNHDVIQEVSDRNINFAQLDIKTDNSASLSSLFAEEQSD